ncbi:MAG: carboxypeptidase-like regulatory domain-containing protein [Planctomycetota bacterium]
MGTGLVIDPESQPIAGAHVFIIPAAEEDRILVEDGDPQAWFSKGIELTSDEEGRFSLDVRLTDVLHAVIARKPGFGWDFAILDPEASEPPQVTLKLEPTAHLHGRVVNKDGDPMSGVRVCHQWSFVWDALDSWPTTKVLYAELMREEVTTDEAGLFRFSEVRHENQDIHAALDGFAPAWLWDVGPDAEVKLTLVASTHVCGSVLDNLGQPVPGATVRSITYGCLPEQATPWLPCRADGSYSIEDAISGSMGVIAWTDQGFASERKNLQVEAGREVRVDFVLHREEQICGRVVNSRDEGVEAAFVSVSSELTGLVMAEVESGEDGDFVGSGLVPGEAHRVSVEDARDYGPRCVLGVPAGAQDVTVRLFELATIWGKLGFDGPASSQVQVRFLPIADLPGNSGMMVLAAYRPLGRNVKTLPITGECFEQQCWPGVYDIEFTAQGYAAILLQNITVAPGRAPRPIGLHFTYPQAIPGVVTDAATGQRIAGACIEVLEEFRTGGLQRSPIPAKAVSDAAGRFDLRVPDRASVAVLVSASGYAPKTVRDVSTRTAGGEELAVALSTGGRIEGRVDTTYGDPSSTIQVVVRELGREDGQSTMVDQKGQFTFGHVPPGLTEVVLTDWYYRVAYFNVGPQVRQVEVHNGETVRVEFDAATGVTLKGQVVGWDKPLLIEARLRSGQGELVTAGACYTDREGGFRIPHLKPGRYSVGSTAGQPGYSIAVSGEVTITSSAPDELVLEVPGNTIRGIVREANGQGIPRAVITVERSEPLAPTLSICLTDAEGAFAIGGLEDGHYDFRARARGFATTIVEGFQVPGPVVDLVLAPEARLRVAVLDDTGAPLAGAVVGLRHTTKRKLVWQDLTGVEGTTTFAALQQVPHVVAATLEGHIPSDPLIVPLREGEMQQVTLVLVRAGELEVTVIDSKGRSLTGIPVGLLSEEGESLEQSSTDQEGKAVFRGLVPGWYEVIAGGDSKTADAVEVLPGESAVLELTLGGSE